MRYLFLSLTVLFVFTTHILTAQVATLSSPDGEVHLRLYLEEGQPFYAVEYAGKTILEKSPLELKRREFQ